MGNSAIHLLIVPLFPAPHIYALSLKGWLRQRFRFLWPTFAFGLCRLTVRLFNFSLFPSFLHLCSFFLFFPLPLLLASSLSLSLCCSARNNLALYMTDEPAKAAYFLCIILIYQTLYSVALLFDNSFVIYVYVCVCLSVCVCVCV